MFSRIYIEDIDIVKTFASECKEYLEKLEKEILKLETSSEDIELLNQIVKKVHGIKRGSSFIGLSGITRVSRETELLLDAINNRTLSAGSEIIDSLLLFVDFLKAYITDLYQRLTEHNFAGETGLMYIEFESVQDEEQVLENLRKAHENSGKRYDKNSEHREQASEKTDLDILDSEEFKRGLSEQIREQFLLENTEHIEKIENDLLIRLDTNSGDKEAVSEIIRTVHSIKGGTGMYLATLSPQSPEYSGLKKYSEVIHTFESLLTLIRDKGCRFESTLVDLGFSVMDHLKSYLRSVDSGKFADLQNDNILNEIKEQISRMQSLTVSTLSGYSLQETSLATLPEPVKTDDAKFKTDDKLKSSVIQSIRVSQEKIDKMMNMISELLIVKNSFMHISAKLNMEYNLPEISKEIRQVGAYISRISDELQNAVMSIRMIEIKTIFQKMPRVVRDIAHSTGKRIELIMEGENTEIDKMIIEQISDPLVHLIRNAADHGIEDLKERLSKGKPETGRIVLRAYNKNKHVFIEVEDDGKGIDPEKVKQKAIEKGFITSSDAEKMSRNQLLNLVFLPGFSTAKQITEISGRGVGMDIVKSNISKVSGNILLESETDKGTKVIIRLPLSLAVSHGLMVEVSGETYIIPLEYIVETVKINRKNIHKYNGRSFTFLRGEVIRIEWLSKIFLTEEADIEKEELNAVILSNGTENFAIVVDKLKNEQEFVIKTLEGHLASIPGISGSTLLGNGQVVLILNPMDILQLAERLVSNNGEKEEQKKQE